MSFVVWPTTRNPSCISSKTSLIVKRDNYANNWQFLLSFTQLPIWRINFLCSGLTTMNFSNTSNAIKQQEPPCINLQKNAFYGSSSNRILNSLTHSSKVRSNHKWPNYKIWIIMLKFIGTLSKCFTSMTMSNHTNQSD